MNLDLFDYNDKNDKGVCILSYLFISVFLYGSERRYKSNMKTTFRRLLNAKKLRFQEYKLQKIESEINSIKALKNIYEDCKSLTLKQKNKMTWFAVNKEDLKYFFSFFIGHNQLIDNLKSFIEIESLQLYIKYLTGEITLDSNVI